MPHLTSIEICAGAGGQAIGLEAAGFSHECLVEIDADACRTLRLNRPKWNVHEGDVKNFTAKTYAGIDLVAGGVPCPPFSVAGKQLGADDERDLFPEAIRIVKECRPKAVLLENVRGFLDEAFYDYRNKLKGQLEKLGYATRFRLLNASDFGVSQLRPRVMIVALLKEYDPYFQWPTISLDSPPTVGERLYDLMSAKKWIGATKWKERANDIAPTIVGGSKKHGGPDLGPTRSRKAWAELGVNGSSIADEAPERDFVGMPRLTVRMAARLQGFPDAWQLHGKKTTAYRQVGNAFPAPVAQAVASRIRISLSKAQLSKVA